MKNTTAIVKSAITGILALTAVSTLFVSSNANAAAEMEKCYGIAAAGKNDCKTSVHACGGSATKDKQQDAFILVPKGLCSKIAGGSPTPGEDK